MKRIYVAGKYNDTDVIKVLNNIKKGTAACARILKRGDVPFCPWLDFQFQWYSDLTVEEYQRYSMSWLEVCDELYVLNNWHTSGGTKREIERARELGIPVVFEPEPGSPYLQICPICRYDNGRPVSGCRRCGRSFCD